MSYSIWGAIAETPWWLYLIFLGIFHLAYQSTKPHNVGMKSALVMPFIFLSMLICALAMSITLDMNKFILLSYTLIPGIFLGWLQFRLRHIKAIKSLSQFHVPGTWSLVVILFLLIAAKIYFFGYGFNINIDTFTQDKNISIIVLLSGLLIGLTIGRTYYLYRCMKYGPFLESK